MTQSSNLKKKSKTSAGAARKQVGTTIKHKNYGKNKMNNAVRTQANASYINQVESSMAARLPSDQRDKLRMIKATGNGAVKTNISNKKHMKKPLTRGRKRK